jgi:hypothetical protein
MTLERSAWRTLVALLAIVSMVVTPSASGEMSPIPADVQVLLFSKIWMFDRSVAKDRDVMMTILYQSTFRASAEAKDRIVDAVRAQGLKIRCQPVALDDTSHVADTLRLVQTDVFYITEMRGINILEVVRVSRSRRIRTITAVPQYLDAGVAIGLQVLNDKPNIVVNLGAARAEGSDLTAQLLRIVTIVGNEGGDAQ